MAHSDLETCRRLFMQARSFWPHILGIFLLSVLATPLALLTPLPLALAVDTVIGGEAFPAALSWLLRGDLAESETARLVIVALLLVAIGLLRHLQGLASWVLQTYTGERLVLGFRTRLFRHVQRLSLGYHDSQGAADSAYRISYDAPAIQWILVNTLAPLLTAILTLIGMFVVTARIDWQLAMIALGIAPALFLLTHFSRRRLRRHWVTVKDLESSSLSLIQEVVGAIRVVRAFGREGHEQDRFTRLSTSTMRGHLRVAVLEGVFNLAIGLTITIGTALALFLGVRHVQTDVISLGELLLVMAYMAQLFGPLAALSNQVAGLQGSLASADRAFQLLDEQPDVHERPHARRLQRAEGAVRFEAVSFRYEEDRWALRDVSFDIPAGSRVGIRGVTGAGKTTLVALLPRFYDPTAGSIWLDGVDLRDYRVADLRDQFAIVLQEPVLFSTTIADNIAYGRPSAGRDEIVAAARAANAHDFIERLPDGYDTDVGTRGVRLSGGERQRISLARAFLRDAPILILDEPTSAVDTATEQAIMEAVERLMVGRTAFIIAHRLSTLERCDVQIEVEHGSVRALGRAGDTVEGGRDPVTAGGGTGSPGGAHS